MLVKVNWLRRRNNYAIKKTCELNAKGFLFGIVHCFSDFNFLKLIHNVWNPFSPSTPHHHPNYLFLVKPKYNGHYSPFFLPPLSVTLLNHPTTLTTFLFKHPPTPPPTKPTQLSKCKSRIALTPST